MILLQGRMLTRRQHLYMSCAGSLRLFAPIRARLWNRGMSVLPRGAAAPGVADLAYRISGDFDRSALAQSKALFWASKRRVRQNAMLKQRRKLTSKHGTGNASTLTVTNAPILSNKGLKRFMERARTQSRSWSQQNPTRRPWLLATVDGRSLTCTGWLWLCS